MKKVKQILLGISALFIPVMFLNIANIPERVDAVEVKSVKPARVITIDMTEIDKISETAALVHRMNVVRETIYATAPFYGVDPDTALYIADCESDFNPHAKNPSSTAKGVFQFTDTTWKYIKAPGHQFDYEENIKQFMIWYPVHPEWWECKG